MYAQVDLNNQNTEELIISLVPKNYRYAIDREIDEWLEINESSKSSENIDIESKK